MDKEIKCPSCGSIFEKNIHDGRCMDCGITFGPPHALGEYRLSFGGRRSIALEKNGYHMAGKCKMNSDVEGIVYYKKYKKTKKT